jgi:hypothetical protein
MPLFFPVIPEKVKKQGTDSLNLSSQGLSQIDSSRSESERKVGLVALRLRGIGSISTEFIGFSEKRELGLSFALLD